MITILNMVSHKYLYDYCRPTVAGIHGNDEEGCYSLALSGGYEDDLDYGVCFTYTGEGMCWLSFPIFLFYLPIVFIKIHPGHCESFFIS